MNKFVANALRLSGSRRAARLVRAVVSCVPALVLGLGLLLLSAIGAHAQTASPTPTLPTVTDPDWNGIGGIAAVRLFTSLAASVTVIAFIMAVKAGYKVFLAWLNRVMASR